MDTTETVDEGLNVLITEDVLPAYREYVEATADLEIAEARRNRAKAKILAFHRENGVMRIKDRGYTSTWTVATRSSLLKNVIEEKFGKLPAECIRTTRYDQLKVNGALIQG